MCLVIEEELCFDNSNLLIRKFVVKKLERFDNFVVQTYLLFLPVRKQQQKLNKSIAFVIILLLFSLTLKLCCYKKSLF